MRLRWSQKYFLPNVGEKPIHIVIVFFVATAKWKMANRSVRVTNKGSDDVN